MTVRILSGDCRAILPTLPANSVHCCITSPPYFGLRDYGTAQWDGGDPGCDHVEMAVGMSDKNTLGVIPGYRETLPQTNSANVGKVRQFRDVCRKCGAVRIDQQIGLESSLEAYLTTLVEVFREVRRVLRDDGTLWLNMGDSYAGSWGAQGRNGQMADRTVTLSRNQIASHPHRMSNTETIRDAGLKPKDLMMVPARLAIALQADGWYLRSDIIWHKPNPMPESVTDRPTSSHEHVFLLTKQTRYFYDAEAVKEENSELSKLVHNHYKSGGYQHKYEGFERFGQNGSLKANGSDRLLNGRNLRNVWTIATHSFPQAHFATFPPALVEPCIKAGTSEKGCCPACGAPWTRVVEKSVAYGSGSGKAGNIPNGKYAGSAQAESGDYDIRMGPQISTQTLGWQPGCTCWAGAEIPPTEGVPCTVLDPFGGAGTVGLVADRLGRNSILIELNPEYAELARNRITGDAPLFAQVTT